jgi:hypothetical protein
VIVSLFTAVAISACGGATLTPAAQIRSNFQRLLGAFHEHDAETVCELLFPFGQDQSASALAAELYEARDLGGPLELSAVCG